MPSVYEDLLEIDVEYSIFFRTAVTTAGDWPCRVLGWQGVTGPSPETLPRLAWPRGLRGCWSIQKVS